MSQEIEFSHLTSGDNRLKAIDTITLEKSIAKAVSDLISVEMQCSISDINFDTEASGDHKAEFSVSLRQTYESLNPWLKNIKRPELELSTAGQETV